VNFFFKKQNPLRKFEFFNKNKLGYIGEACFSSGNLTKFATFRKKIAKLLSQKNEKIKNKWESHVL